jgi:hypothetical protein
MIGKNDTMLNHESGDTIQWDGINGINVHNG